MSNVYLPNGAHIIIHHSWTQTNESNGNLTLKSNDGKNDFYGLITPQGVAHLTDKCRHTYIPPGINNLDTAFGVVEENLAKIPGWKLKRLKKALEKFDSRTQSFK